MAARSQRAVSCCASGTKAPPALFPYVAERSFTAPDALVETYLRMLDTLGIERAVLVQGSAHGTDKRAAARAVASAPKRLRGVAVIGPDTPESEVRALHAQGFRGTRLSTVGPFRPQPNS